jgi:1-acyl-sn-glycerol-3-phosphate acyltransferase
MAIFRRDALGNLFLLKRFLFWTLGLFAHYRFRRLNETEIRGAENLRNLPVRNVLFVSNHQTYFADVALMLLVFFSVRNKYNKVGPLWGLFNPQLRIYFVAAAETMKAGILPRLMGKAGGILVKRTWREKGKDINRPVDTSDQNQVKEALKDGWVITFPQGTTRPYVKGRKGTAYMIKENKPVVVPIVVDGMRRGFDKKGLYVKKKGVNISFTIKPPLNLDYNAEPDDILDQVMDAIEQSERYYPPNLKEIQEKVKDENPSFYG